MRVLAITGDKSFKSGHPRFDLQSSAVEKFEVVYWGIDALFPRIPKGNFDVVTTQDPFFRGIVGWIVAYRLKLPLNVQVHADLEKQNALKYFIASFILPRADSVRVVSNRIKAQVEKLKIKSRITVLPVFVDLEPFRKIERVESENPIILWIGRFEDEKNPLLALNIFRQVSKEISNAKLIMLGSGSLEKELKEKSKDLNVEFPGWGNPSDYLKEASVVFSTSRSESWGASIVEALASGVPVVAPDVGIAKEAGARVTSSENLPKEIIRIINEKDKGILKLNPLSKEEWAEEWKSSLI